MTVNRFEVSDQGMREIHAGRKPSHLVRELVQNSWDEYPNATECRVVVASAPGSPDATRLVVEDDGKGFRRIEDAYTLLGPTEKRSDPTKRGRFNLGEKELVSIAIEAKVTTVGRTVEFPPEGGRRLRSNGRERGTRISALMPWDARQRAALVEELRTFRPTHCALFVNGTEIPRRLPLAVRRAKLPTVIQDSPGEPLRRSTRTTDIDILAPIDGQAYLYELGIPVQATDLAFDVDIGQKVPLNPHRDAVSPGYLKAVSAEVLNEMHQKMTAEQASGVWTRMGLEDSRIEEAAVRSLVQKRYGDRVVIGSSSRDANLAAVEAGYTVLPSRSLSPDERGSIRRLGGVGTAGAMFPNALLKALTGTREVKPNEDMREFAEWVVELGKAVGLAVTVKFIRADNDTLADCTVSTADPTIRFNAARLSPEFFKGRGEEQLNVAIHELSHAASVAGAHGPSWGYAACGVGAKIAPHLSRPD